MYIFEFLLTRPSRDVTERVLYLRFRLLISTHTSLAGRDVWFDEMKDQLTISTHTSLAGRDFFRHS